MPKIFSLALAIEDVRSDPASSINLYQAIYQLRVKNFETTGKHLPTISMDTWRELWYSVYSETGASAEIVKHISQAIDEIGTCAKLHDIDLGLPFMGRLEVGDRFELDLSAFDSESITVDVRCAEDFKVWDLYRKAVVIPVDIEAVLLSARWALRVMLSDATEATEHEALVKHKKEVVAAISEPRVWKASGELHYEKVRKQLVDKVSSIFKNWSNSGMDAIAKMWRSSAVHSLGASTIPKGQGFEYDIAQIYMAAGFDVEFTPHSGDFGVDLIVKHGAYRLAIQAKDWSGNAGVEAVQQVVSGGQHYQCDKYLVVARNGFTEAARALAHSTETTLETFESLRRKMRDALIIH